MKIIIYTISILCLLSSCAKEKIMYYEGPDAISIYIGRYDSDSVIYSFLTKLPEVVQDTVKLRVRIQGAATAVDRRINLVATDGTTAVENRDYILSEITFPAGATEILYPVVLLRSPNIREESKRLYVKIDPNNFFMEGALGLEIGNTLSIPYFKIIFNDNLSEPIWWGYLAFEIGSFSVTKLQFIISVYGEDYNFEGLFFPIVYEGITYMSPTPEVGNLPLRLRTALMKYELANGPLIDEFGNRITF